jgi:hypothetical protein
MGLERYSEQHMMRMRGTEHAFTATGSFTWLPERDGSFLRLNAGAGGPWTLTLSITLPGVPTTKTGMRLWVEYYQGGAGGSLITWPGTFSFQTAGDQIPAAAAGKTTIWTGIYGVGASTCFMTRLGEW